MTGVATVIRRVMLVVTLTGAVIVGLLAMHTLTGGSVAAPDRMSMEHHALHGAHDHAAVIDTGSARGDNATTSRSTVTSECAGDCGGAPIHDMALMGCVLAFVILLLLFSPLVAHLRHRAPLRHRTESASLPVALAAHPPDLTSLCISRT